MLLTDKKTGVHEMLRLWYASETKGIKGYQPITIR